LFDLIELEKLLPIIAELSIIAGEKTLEVYHSDFAIETKDDKSPVTMADKESEKIITEKLRQIAPHIPIIAEEASAAGKSDDITGRDEFWLIDPLDGTKEFVRRNGEFTVNIGLIQKGKPVMGVIYIPVQEKLYMGIVGLGAWKKDKYAEIEPIHASNVDKSNGMRMISSRSHSDLEGIAQFTADKNIISKDFYGSSIKFGIIAEGKADIYPRLKPTMEWDTAAGHAILKAAGGMVEKLSGEELTYGNKPFLNPFFVAYGNRNNE